MAVSLVEGGNSDFPYVSGISSAEGSAFVTGIHAYTEADAEKTPVFTQVWGRQLSQVSIVKTVEESAFGEQKVTESTRTNRDFIITGASSDPYIWDDESTITAQEFKAALADREVALAAIKQRQDEYNASRAQTQAPAATTGGASGFNF